MKAMKYGKLDIVIAQLESIKDDEFQTRLYDLMCQADRGGLTPLISAAYRNKNTQIIDQLLNPIKNFQWIWNLLEHADNEGYTAVAKAAERGKTAIANRLLKALDDQLVDFLKKSPALRLAVEHRHIKTINAFLASVVPEEIEGIILQPYDGKPLLDAIQKSVDVAEALLEKIPEYRKEELRRMGVL